MRTVAVAATITGAMYPTEYVKSSEAPNTGESCVAANARMAARMGVEQGEAASANVKPAAYAMTTGGTGRSRTSTLREGKDTGSTSTKLRPISTATTPTPANSAMQGLRHILGCYARFYNRLVSSIYGVLVSQTPCMLAACAFTCICAGP